MHVNINLATEPYEDTRHFAGVWISIIGALLILAVVLGIAAGVKWRSYRQMSANIARERSVLSDLDNKQRQDLAILDRSENRDVRTKSEFLNDLILRKELSWTKIFTDLEGMMPPHLRVLSVEPKYNLGQLQVNLTLGGDSRERAAELVRRMEKSQSFRNALMISEAQAQTGQAQGDPMRFAITAEYLPESDMPTQSTAPTQVAGNRGGNQ